MKRNRNIAVLGLVFLVGCWTAATWATIILAAQSVALLAGTADPALSAYSALAVSLLTDIENAITTFDKTDAQSDLAKVQAAIEAIDTQLPDALTKLNVPAAIKQRVEAAMQIILDYVDARAVAQPKLRQAAIARRALRTATPAPKPLTKGDIEWRWKHEVCGGDATCSALITRKN